MMRALYGQAQALPASLFELGISPHINASIIVSLLLLLPKDLLPFPWAARLREARKEGKGVSESARRGRSVLHESAAAAIGSCYRSRRSGSYSGLFYANTLCCHCSQRTM
jgi:preprotein translocase subunit SecY